MTHRFGASAPYTVGVEEELFLVDVESLDAAPAFSAVVPDPSERLKPELFACLVETTTPICASVEDARVELMRLRREVLRRADPLGVTILAAAAHPFAESEGQPIVPEPRYEKIRDELGDAVYRQLVCGLHVHVGMPSAEMCLRVLEGVVPWLPVLLALSANSPYIDGVQTGARSSRAGRLAELPSVGPPPVLRSWADWERATAGQDYTRIWWDARPHPRYGTLEVRMCDQQTDVARSAGFAALVQALAAAVSEEQPEPFDRDEYARRRVQAALARPEPADVEGLFSLVRPFAHRFGVLELVQRVLEEEQEATRQLEVGAEGDLRAVARDVVERSLA